ncbi:hypothetical protein [Neorhodopirellula pilleata]|uniref:hypothetical protein n=1 Tax=Neorhodopirellula pilleata TaxID=2714738 RepID=UPI0018CF17C0|nr:hypothetical protein [Neorhodopirellula pilleata]
MLSKDATVPIGDENPLAHTVKDGLEYLGLFREGFLLPPLFVDVQRHATDHHLPTSFIVFPSFFCHAFSVDLVAYSLV